MKTHRSLLTYTLSLVALAGLTPGLEAQERSKPGPHGGFPVSGDCQSCHGGHAGGYLGSQHDGLLCTDCHDPHGQTNNLHTIRETIDTPNSGPRPVLLLAEQGPNSYADGDAVYDGVCEVCHTQTDHHRNDASGDHAHFAALNCTDCHDHWNGYLAPPHPEAVTDCSICHGDPITGAPTMVDAHGADCSLCHPTGFTSTILGPLGTWNGECNECHNPAVVETGSLAEFTKGHRCIVCHSSARDTTDITTIHQDHGERVNCVVCHGFIPDVGTEIGSGNRDVCATCHVGGKNESIPQFHERHAEMGVSCLECHADVRPPVDVVPGPPVGNATHVCAVCHSNHDPSNWGNSQSQHERHTAVGIDCGACHAMAHLQDDRDPMPEVDDVVRMQVPRADYMECSFCHNEGPEPAFEVHQRHVADQAQWCFNCHEGSDLRPLGITGPVTTPAESCVLCHDDETYNDMFPFSVHHRHSRGSSRVKCYACHQTMPALRDWPDSWHQGAGFTFGPLGSRF